MQGCEVFLLKSRQVGKWTSQRVDKWTSCLYQRQSNMVSGQVDKLTSCLRSRNSVLFLQWKTR